MIQITPNTFDLHTSFSPKGDQPAAIEQLVEGLADGEAFQTLLGATGTGKTYTMANVIAKTNRPALVLAPNKVLCAQLYSEFKSFFPNAKVEYFVSYFDYYQPETYLPAQDKFIDKDSMINEYLQMMRLSATKSILTRNDTIIIATVSAIFGLGEIYQLEQHTVRVQVMQQVKAGDITKQLVKARYENVSSKEDHILASGEFRVRGDTLLIYPAETEEYAIRVSFFDDLIEDIKLVDPLTGAIKRSVNSYIIFPATHYTVGEEQLDPTIAQIKAEMEERVKFFTDNGKFIEAQRIRERVEFDLEMLNEIGYCRGIENYSRIFTGRKPGEPPTTLLDYLPKNAIVFVDESHTTMPQLSAMYAGDRARKVNLVDFGFRLPSALDARPLKFEEILDKLCQTIFVSATPGEFELSRSGVVAEQIIRPTGVVDPDVEIRPAGTQVDDLMSEVTKRAADGERVLVTVLTKQMAQQLADYYADHGLRARYMHGEVEAVERVEIIRDLRLGAFDVLVGINLLREGLDLPEVSLVAIMDADKEGFLRANRSLIQTIGRAARNVHGHVIMYADKVTRSMEMAIAETNRRRIKQLDFNKLHGITPVNVENKIRALLDQPEDVVEVDDFDETKATISIKKMERQMKDAAANLEFELAAKLRDRISKLRAASVGLH